MLEKAEGAATGPEKVKVEFDNFEHGFPEGFGPGWWGRLAYWIGIAFAIFQLYVAAFNYLPSQVVRGVHVGFLLLLSFGLIANFTAKSGAGRALGWVIGGAGFFCGLYQWFFYADLIARDGDPTRLDLVVGTLLAVLIFEGTRRLMGAALPLMCGACLVYWFFGQYLPSPLNHRGYDFDQIVTHLSFGTEGFYGVPIYVSATYIFLFILFGSFLERAGMIQLFTDVSLGLFGRTRGGPAKVAVFASGMMGTISGSGVANVVTVGQFTIPLMIRFGYRRAFAAGVVVLVGDLAGVLGRGARRHLEEDLVEGHLGAERGGGLDRARTAERHERQDQGDHESQRSDTEDDGGGGNRRSLHGCLFRSPRLVNRIDGCPEPVIPGHRSRGTLRLGCQRTGRSSDRTTGIPAPGRRGGVGAGG